MNFIYNGRGALVNFLAEPDTPFFCGAGGLTSHFFKHSLDWWTAFMYEVEFKIRSLHLN